MVDKHKIRDLFDGYFTISGKITINDDGTVDCYGTVQMIRKSSRFPVRFGTVENGWFDCTGMGLTSLDGAPVTVDGTFDCCDNLLKNLEGGPTEVDLDYVVYNNPLESLKGFPKILRRLFKLDYDPKLPLLRVLTAKRGVYFLPSFEYPYIAKIQSVLFDFAGQGKAGAMACSLALLKLERELKEKFPSINLRENVKW